MVTHCDRHGIKFEVGGRGVVEVTNRRKNIPYILESNPHQFFADFLNEKKVCSRFQSAPFLQPPLVYKAD